MKKLINWLKNEESGQGMVEYGLIIVIIGAVIFVGFSAFGDRISDWFANNVDLPEGKPAS